MKKKVLVLFVCLSSSVNMFGQSGIAGWNLGSDSVLTLTGIAMLDYSINSPSEWYDLRNKFSSVVIGPGMGNIGNLAFYECAKMASITMPLSVTNIGDSVFVGCDRLSFVSLPKEVISIGQKAFHASGLDSIIIPNSVTNIGDSAFAGCRNLKSVTVYWETPLPLLEADSVFNKVDLSEARLYVPIGKKDAYAIAPVWMDFDSIIEWRGGTIGIEPLSWGIDGDSVLTISGYGAIPDYDTTSLAPWHEFLDDIIKVVIDNGVNGIGTNAFYGCALVDTITIPATVTSLGDSVFVGCQSLLSIEVDPMNAVYCSTDGILFNKQKTTIYTYPVGKPDSAYLLPATVRTIGNTAFAECDSLRAVVLPELLTSIGYAAFAGCGNLKDVTVYWNEPLALVEADSVFSRVDLSVATLHVPYGKRMSYANAPVWGEFGARVEMTTGTAGSLLWSMSGDTLTISGTEAMPHYTLASPAPWQSFKDTIKTVVIETGVTGIGDYAFYACDSILSIALSDSVKTIGDNAFYGCAIDSIAIPDWVTSIGDSVFAGCRNLVSIETGATNTAYSSENGILFNLLKTIIYTYPAGKPETGYSIPSTVRTIGKAAFAGCDSLRSVGLPDSLISIGNAAFAGCSRLDSIAIPDSVTSIGSYAFANCAGLTDVSVSWTTPLAFADTTTVFQGLTLSSRTLHIPAGTKALYQAAPVWKHFGTMVESEYGTVGSLIWSLNADTLSISGTGAIPDYNAASPAPWYSFVDKILTVVIDTGVIRIGNYAFYGCDSLTSITLSDSIRTIGSNAFAGCSRLDTIMIPDQVTSIGDSAFIGCSNLSAIIAGIDNTEFSSLDGVLFDKTKTLIHAYPAGKPDTEYVLPATVTNIRNAAFYGCDSLAYVTLNNGLIGIGNYAFYGCNLDFIAIPASVTTIGTGVFAGCENLSSITVASTNADYSSENGILFNKTQVTIYAYPAGKAGSEYVIPATVTSVAPFAFYGCNSLASVTLPDVLRNIGNSAFYGCNRIDSITIPKTVERIDDYAFAGCSSLTSVKVYWDTPLSIADSVFSGVNQPARLYIPLGKGSLYVANTVWGEFEIYEFDATGVEVIEAPSVQAYFYGGVLYVNSPSAETIDVYSLTGARLFSAPKQEGHATLNVNQAKSQILIVRGTSGWVRKIKN